MTPPEVYTHLRHAAVAAPCEPFDAHVLACIFAAGSAECASGGSLADALGLGGGALRQTIDRYFPDANNVLEAFRLDGEPLVSDEEQSLRELLRRFRTMRSPLESALSVLIARRSMRPNHLWQDLGLDNRGELSTLMQHHFTLLAQRNTQDMKWKKFFYRMICREDGFRLCAAPSCSECNDFVTCFGDESGESLLARVRYRFEAPGPAPIASALPAG